VPRKKRRTPAGRRCHEDTDTIPGMTAGFTNKSNMAKAAKFDVWFLTADQVYKGVPFQVVAGWVEQGRVSANDKVRPAGVTQAPWLTIGAHPLLSDYLTPQVAMAIAPDGATTSSVEAIEAPEPELGHRKAADEDDDDVDMIPLIDISLVLLVFFMMTTAVSALSPIDVPSITTGSEASQDADAITVQIDLRESGEAYYAIRVGDKPIEKENNNLDTLAQMAVRLDAVLGTLNRPPEVRIACHKKLKHVRVRELAMELEKRRVKGQIAFYAAEVNEQPKQ
jgi:biopolymer transport protein ExbD